MLQSPPSSDKRKNQIRATKSKTKAPGQGGAIVKSPKGAITKPPSSKPASQRVERVKVKVDGQRQLPGSGSKPALKPGTNRTSPRGRAAAKAAQAARGSRGTGVRAAGGSGLPKQTPRLPKAGQTARNLLRNKALTRGPAGKLSGIGLILSGAAEAQSLAKSLKRGEGYAALPGMVKRALTAKAPERAKGPRDRRGKPINPNRKPSVKPARRGMSNLGSNYKADEARLAAAARPTKKTEKQATVKPAVKASQPANTTKAAKATKPAKPTKRTDRMSKVVAELKDMQKRSKDRQKAQKPKLSKRKQMLNRKKKRLEAAASGPGASARDKFFNRKARRYS